MSRALAALGTLALAACPKEQSPEAEARARELYALLAADKTAEAHARFDARMKTALPPEKLRQVWDGLVAGAGPAGPVTAARSQDALGHHAVTLTAAFARGSVDVMVTVTPTGEVAGLFLRPGAPPPARVPPYADRTLFLEKAITVGAPPWALPGTLSLPKKLGVRVPALVLVHGSGPHDRDGSMGANAPYRDLAWGLASRGIAVLRYEKRTKAHAPAMVAAKEKITLEEEVVQDALAAVALLRGNLSVDPERIFVLGHSLGGLAVPRLAKRDPRIAGFILMAVPSRPLEDLLVAQLRYLGQAAQAAKAEAAARRVKGALTPATPAAELPLGLHAAYWLDLRAHPHVPGMREVRQPLLFLQGGRDYQVTLEDLEGWKSALRGRKDVRFRVFPNGSHLLIDGAGKPSPADYGVPGHVSPEAIQKIAAFVLGRIG